MFYFQFHINTINFIFKKEFPKFHRLDEIQNSLFRIVKILHKSAKYFQNSSESFPHKLFDSKGFALSQLWYLIALATCGK